MKPTHLLLPALATVVFGLPPHTRAESRGPDLGSARYQEHVAEAFGRLPLRFERNDGQTDPRVLFLSRGPGYGLFLTPGEVVLSLRGPAKPQAKRAAGRVRRVGQRAREREHGVLRMRFLEGRARPEVAGTDELTGTSHYLRGADPRRWCQNVPQYRRVVYRNVWPGIDVAFYGTSQGQLESDFTVSPGADPRLIGLGFEGARTVQLDEGGHLVLEVGTGEVVQNRPLVYQDLDGERTAVSGSWVLEGPNRVGFRVASYDRSRPLVIDPVLVYSTSFGGSRDDWSDAIAVDAAGNAYVTGAAESVDFPIAGTPPQPGHGGGYTDAFVARLSPTGALVYSTYLGGGGEDGGRGIAVDAAGNAYVTGDTGSDDFPTAGTPSQPAKGAYRDAFVAKLSPTSSLVYSTFLGGSGWDLGLAIALDAATNAYVMGNTDSADFPTVGPPSQLAPGDSGDVFVTKLSPTSALVYSTYLGGTGFEWTGDIAVDAIGNAHVVGGTYSTDFPIAGTPIQATGGGDDDGFVATLGPTWDLVYSTYLGGNGDWESAYAVAVDTGGDVYVTGVTNSTDFPTAGPPFQAALAGGRDAFVTRLDLATGLVYSSYLGGSGNDSASGIAVDASATAHVVGGTGSEDFPTTAPPLNTSGGFLAKMGPTSELVYSAYQGDLGLGGVSRIALDAAGDAYLGGTTQPADSLDVFVSKLRWPIAEVNLKVDGADAVYPDYVMAPNPVKLTIDMTANPKVLDHYYYYWVGGTFYWLTSTGVSTTPAPLASFAPVDLTDFELLSGNLSSEVWIFGWLLLDGATLVHSDFIVAFVLP